LIFDKPCYFLPKTLNNTINGKKYKKNSMLNYRFQTDFSDKNNWHFALTPASADAVRGANFATAKFRDAYGSPLEAFVYAQHGRELMR
jgi:hypothetical protein